jgi:hypothetical protein
MFKYRMIKISEFSDESIVSISMREDENVFWLYISMNNVTPVKSK